MLIDHVGLMFFPQYQIFRMIGRISFPIFCFLLAEGFIHTRSWKRYILRLIAFAFISEAPYRFFKLCAYGTGFWEMGGSLNVMFELAAGFAGMAALCIAEKRTASGKYLQAGIGILVFACTAAAAELLNFSYGAYGIMMIGGFYMLRSLRYPRALWAAVCTSLHCFAGGGYLQSFAAAAAVPLLFYSGKRGRALSKYAFYAFYPLHMLVLGLVSMLI